ncbi:phage portal protein [Acinetobacter nosocomialis]|uniref:phage portal protein n=1 Tax=Acinetobacter nosocomialis TaxID=106654 RepID=UPI0002CD8F18|nr:phage portal protein [Acinetobacter nosocomialis]ENU46282.1 HK97 family phage portal protein [Acinetobacter nosocomialis NIPH 2119]QXC11290.1 phage portal protein [Acinetobacter nosocomialis]
MSKNRNKAKGRQKDDLKKLKVRGTGPMQDRTGTTLIDRPRSAVRTAKPVTFDSAMTLSAVFACVKILVESVATLPLQMFKLNADGSRTIVKDHPVIQLLSNKPNRYQTAVEFREHFMLNLVAGNAVCKRDYIGKKLVSLQVINSGSVDLKIKDNGDPVYECQINGRKVELTEKQVWHVKMFGTSLWGMSPIAYGAASIGVGLSASDKTTRLMSNGAKPTGALKTKRILKDAQRDKLRTELDILVNGDDGDIAVLEDDMQFEQISLTPADLELIQIRKLSVEDACRFFGVPPILVYLMDGATTWGDGIDKIIDGFYKFGLRPYLERIEESIRIHLLEPHEWDLYEFEFKTKDLLRASYLQRIAANKDRIISGQSSINEIRREEGDTPDPNGDFLLVPVNMTTAERMKTGNYKVKEDDKATASAK